MKPAGGVRREIRHNMLLYVGAAEGIGNPEASGLSPTACNALPEAFDPLRSKRLPAAAEAPRPSPPLYPRIAWSLDKTPSIRGKFASSPRARTPQRRRSGPMSTQMSFNRAQKLQSSASTQRQRAPLRQRHIEYRVPAGRVDFARSSGRLAVPSVRRIHERLESLARPFPPRRR